MRERLRVLVAAGADKDMRVYYAQLRDRRALSDAGTLRRGAGPDPRRPRSRARSPRCARCWRSTPQITALYGSLGQALQAASQPGRRRCTLFERAWLLFPRNVPLTSAMPKR